MTSWDKSCAYAAYTEHQHWLYKAMAVLQGVNPSSCIMHSILSMSEMLVAKLEPT